MILAHIAGIPVEEALLSFAPVIFAGGGVAGIKTWLRHKDRRDPEKERR